MISRFFPVKAFLLLSAITLSAMSISHAATSETTSKHYVVVGATRHIGYAVAQHLLTCANTVVTLVVHDSLKAMSLFRGTKARILEGDLSKSTSILDGIKDKIDTIVLAPVVPYKVWEDTVRGTTKNAIAVAKKRDARVLQFSRTYAYPVNASPISESTLVKNSSDLSHQGRVMYELGEQLKNSGVKGGIITTGIPYGEQLGDSLFEELFKDPSSEFMWIAQDCKQQLTYTGDIARFVPTYCNYLDRLLEANGTKFDCINFSSPLQIANSIQEFANEYGALCGIDTVALGFHGEGKLKAGKFFGNQNAKRALDVYAYFANTVLLDTQKLVRLFPDFVFTDRLQSLKNIQSYYSRVYA